MNGRIGGLAAGAVLACTLTVAAPAVAGGDGAPPHEPSTGAPDIVFGPHESGTKSVTLPATAAQVATARANGWDVQGARETGSVGGGSPKAAGAGSGPVMTATVSPAVVVGAAEARRVTPDVIPPPPSGPPKVHRRNFSQRWCWPPGPLGTVFACERHKGHVYYDGRYVWENVTYRHRHGRHLCGLESGVAGSTTVKYCLNYHHKSRRFTSMWDIFTINYSPLGGNGRDTIGAWVHVGPLGGVKMGDKNLD